MKKLSLGLLAGLLFATTAACGGGGGRPSVEEISKVMQDGSSAIGAVGGELEAEAADCMAKAFHESDLSDDALNALVNNDTDFKGDEDDTKALSGAMTKMAECALAGIEIPDAE